MERPFIGLVRSSPEGERRRDVTLAIVTPVTSHVQSSSNTLTCYLANGSHKICREAANTCVYQCGRVAVEGLLRQYVEETEIH